MGNFHTKLESIINCSAPGQKLALHVCCAPCAIPALETLTPHFSITLFYYNPNIYPDDEYDKRFENIKKLIHIMPCSKKNGLVGLIEGFYDLRAFRNAVSGLESEPESGARCRRCITLRLSETARFAKENGFDYFCSTLTTGPNKDAVYINSEGERLAEVYGVPFLPSDFKKRDGYKRSVELSNLYGIYRQNYCGCQYALL